MNIKEEFKKWWETQSPNPLLNNYRKYNNKQGWNACAELMQKEIDKKDAELAALRDLDELKSLILRMDKVKEEYGCGFYNQKDWYDDYKLIVKIAKGE